MFAQPITDVEHINCAVNVSKGGFIRELDDSFQGFCGSDMECLKREDLFLLCGKTVKQTPYSKEEIKPWYEPNDKAMENINNSSTIIKRKRSHVSTFNSSSASTMTKNSRVVFVPEKLCSAYQTLTFMIPKKFNMIHTWNPQ